jgi:hypothetical protein
MVCLAVSSGKIIQVREQGDPRDGFIEGFFGVHN